MKYCTNCGAELPAGTTICRSCGQGVNLAKPDAQVHMPQGGQAGNASAFGQQGGMAGGQQGYAPQGAPAWRQGAQAPLGAPPSSPSGGSSGKTGILIGCGVLAIIFVILLVIGGVGYYLYQKDDDVGKPAAPMQQQTQPPASSASSAQGGSSRQSSAEWNDLVREKDEIDIAIGEIASRANRHLSSYPDFRNAPGLINDARAVTERARKAESRAAALQGIEQARCNALRALFAVEVHRAQGLYKGMLDSSNGGDYSYGFGEGTTASYAFDQANADFDRLHR